MKDGRKGDPVEEAWSKKVYYGSIAIKLIVVVCNVAAMAYVNDQT